MTWEIYLLSILENLAEFTFGATIFFAVISVGFLILKTITLGDYLKSPQYHEKEIKLIAKYCKLYFILLPLAFIFGLITILIPSKKSIAESYLMIEGKDLATSENVEKIFEKLDSKSDKLIEKLGEENE